MVVLRSFFGLKPKNERRTTEERAKNEWGKNETKNKEEIHMAQLKKNAITVTGSLRKDGITIYKLKGKTVMRSATSEQPLRRTRGQFVTRQRIAHTTALWKRLRAPAKPLFTHCANIFGRFSTLMRKLPVVFRTKEELSNGASLLIPDMPLSDGMLPNITYRLDEVDGQPALLTNLKMKHALGSNPTVSDMVSVLCGRGTTLETGDTLRLYSLRQTVEYMVPKVYIRMEELVLENSQRTVGFTDIEMQCVDGHLALIGSCFADDTMGWGLVHVSGERCSSQTVVTRCNMYEQYTTEEALDRAAKSYGGLTDAGMITPDND